MGYSPWGPKELGITEWLTWEDYFQVFKGISILFSVVNKPIYIPTNSVREFPFLYILSSILFADILMLDILNSVRWYLTIFLIFISLIISGVEHLFMALLATCMSSLEKCVFTFSAHFSIGFFPVFFFFFCYFVAWVVSILWINPFSVASFPNIFPQSVNCPFAYDFLCFIYGFLCCPRAWWDPICLFLLYFYCLGRLI